MFYEVLILISLTENISNSSAVLINFLVNVSDNHIVVELEFHHFKLAALTDIELYHIFPVIYV